MLMLMISLFLQTRIANSYWYIYLFLNFQSIVLQAFWQPTK